LVVVQEDDISMGKVDPLTGFVKFRIKYDAVMFRPFRNEVLDAPVKSVTEMGFFVQAGPVEIFVADVVSGESEPWDACSGFKGVDCLFAAHARGHGV
jgi:DNA-directed RNA polymerase subunit E'/Rpb7